ncbi:MAG: NAD(P)-binding domain-containing protein [Candidatus Neomarinimicrobiota bacterium]
MNGDTLISWGLGLLIALLFLVPYIWNMRRKERLARSRLSETRAKGQDQALMQHPIINRSVCIGCGICVAACPEGDVLGLIGGKATIIHGSHCVGHGRCAEACPVGGIEVGLGDISQREDIPYLSDHFETNIPGLYIIGELSGLALIRNAIHHGVTAVDHIAATRIARASAEWDVVIIGAGPAGLAAALRAREQDLNYLLLDQDRPGGTILNYPRKKITLVQKVTLPLYGELKKYEYSKEELLAIWEKMIAKYAINLRTDHKLLGVTSENSVLRVSTSQGEELARKVILALGRRGTPRKLGVPGENSAKVMYKLIDAETYRDCRLLVVGGGDSAVEAAIGLARQLGNQVTLSYRKADFFRLKSRNEQNIAKLRAEGGIEVLFNSNLTAIEPDRVRLEQQGRILEIDNDYVFIFAGGELPFPLLNSMGIAFGARVEAAGE